MRTVWVVVVEGIWDYGTLVEAYEEWRDASAAYRYWVGQSVPLLRVRLIPFRTNATDAERAAAEVLALDANGDLDILAASREFRP